MDLNRLLHLAGLTENESFEDEKNKKIHAHRKISAAYRQSVIRKGIFYYHTDALLDLSNDLEAGKISPDEALVALDAIEQSAHQSSKM